ncbi:glycine cleavage system H protein [bacterium BMS3Bbin11]|nr:glycine cleavage system H protein [bacterium BMS3Abin11]GBE45135.1 glycine cleavage system H protein [bacterium BMS3Bbin11]HDH16586.1 glycine cleavage system protein GcvH [Gammaproteobacteria bacterium]HDZ77714.1 glycine cleavage system protein GcvH [Gammaproteobacteria bacterium]
MSNVPQELKYTKSHEWVLTGEDGLATIGITDYAQDLLGDMVFIELPEIDKELDAGDECAVVESVKAASDVYAPIAGKVVAVNERLVDAPELINEDPYGEGWMLRLQIEDVSELDGLMDADVYEAIEGDE